MRRGAEREAVGGEEMKTYGYIRVSTKEQNPDRQIAAMREFGLSEDDLVIEAQSGFSFDRMLYRDTVKRLKAGDVFVVKSIDRLGRNYAEILEEWRLITKTHGADIVVLDMPLLDTRRSRDLTGTLIADIVLQLLSYVAETEREFIRQRQREGIDAAKARGVRFGRKKIRKPEGWPEMAARYFDGELGAGEIAEKAGVSLNTVYRWLEKDRSEKRGDF